MLGFLKFHACFVCRVMRNGEHEVYVSSKLVQRARN